MTSYRPYQFAVWRVAFGLFLAVHFAGLAPWAAELFSTEGIFPNHARFLFLGELLRPDGRQASAFVWLMSGLSLLLALGVGRRIVALALWYGWACLFNMNDFISNPSYPYIGWLLLACAVIPAGEPLSFTRRSRHRQHWELPATVFWGAWLLLALGYCASGLHKLGSPSWVDGRALEYVLTVSPFGRDWWGRTLLLELPVDVLPLLTWWVLALEISFPILCLHRRTRFLGWCGAVLMHAGVLLLLDLTELSWAMLLFHFFAYDPAWYPPGRGSIQPGAS
jgi:hypothetical protein